MLETTQTVEGRKLSTLSLKDAPADFVPSRQSLRNAVDALHPTGRPPARRPRSGSEIGSAQAAYRGLDPVDVLAVGSRRGASGRCRRALARGRARNGRPPPDSARAYSCWPSAARTFHATS